ncbi:MAG TPA: thiamine pyrophosphate-binding protein [Burkholderiales bacterium]|jgi:thiamine pyrophosphate-dependent acetolactate synthase large subunit-like protein|nr:thiamine pyrophosphate-binding protein [Burkholderiales bacterium]
MTTRDVPVASPVQQAVWGSDAIAAMLRALDIPYLALNPGASYRGLHDSIVNYLGNERPQMLLCLHEEAAVAIAHGYAKASGRMMGVVLHSNVGLMHGSMAIFNAWCDRVPMLILGATGPWDAARRRPWIDWIHTASDQGALVRDYTKWDNQPASVPAAYEALLRAVQIADTAPRGPTYVNFDAALQEAKIGSLPPLPDVARFRSPPAVFPSREAVQSAAQILSAAKSPAILVGRVSRSEAAWKARIALAEKLQARVFTDIKTPAAFPTDHPLHAAPPATFADGKLLKDADVILSLDWVDTAGTLKAAWGDSPVGAKVIRVSLDAHVHRGWSMDYQGLPPSDVYLMCEPDVAVPLLLDAVRARPALALQENETHPEPDTAVSIRALARAFNELTEGMDVCLSKLPLGWNGAYRHFRHPLDYLGADGGGGVGAGPGLTIGAALAMKEKKQGSGRMVTGIMGDGDYLMGVTALWTATHYKLPCLMLVANNRSFYNDEMHQERVARERGRPVENKWIGQRIDEPDIDLAAMARAQGAVGIGPVKQLDELKPSLVKAIKHVKAGEVCVVDVRVVPGYDAPMSGATAPARR